MLKTLLYLREVKRYNGIPRNMVGYGKIMLFYTARGFSVSFYQKIKYNNIKKS